MNNTHYDYRVKAHLMDGTEGEICIGNETFEFCGENKNIEIDWNQITKVRIKSIGELINAIYIEYDRFVLALSSQNNYSLLKRMQRYVKRERFIPNKTFTEKLSGKA